jgi:hypothetical protein
LYEATEIGWLFVTSTASKNYYVGLSGTTGCLQGISMEIRSLFSLPMKLSRATLRLTGFDITRYPRRLRPDRRQELERRIRILTENTVTGGIFSGLVLSEEEAWVGQGSKLLGLYENELQPILVDVVRSGPDTIINVGCADGYYALGLARLLKDAKVFAYDINERAQNICEIGRKLNSLNESLVIGGYCSATELQNVIRNSQRPFALIDCEGGERELLLSDEYDFANAQILVECHDFVDRNITPDIVRKFSRTHTIQVIEQGARNPFLSEVTRDWAEDDLWLIVSESRPERMHWLNLIPNIYTQ